MNHATRVLTNAKIATMDGGPSEIGAIAEALAIRGGRIAAVGSAADIEGLVGPQTEVIDLAGATVIPGIIDSHCHPDSAALGLSRPKLRPPAFASIDDVLAAIRRHAAESGPDDWFMGDGYNNGRMGGYPTREQLDVAAEGRPVIIYRMDGHVAVVNSRAFEIAGVAEDVADPAHGQYDRDPATGRLTGVVREEAFFQFRRMFRSETDTADYEATLPKVFEQYLGFGITGVHNSVTRTKVFRAYQNLKRAGRLNMRVGVIINGDDDDEFQTAVKAGLQSGLGDDWLRIVGVEWIADASVGGRTAAFYEPYRGEPDLGEPVPNTGMQLFAKDYLEPRVNAAHRAGLTVCIEGLGDRGVDFALDLIEGALAREPRDDHRMRIEHCCCVPDAQMARIEALGVVPSSATAFLHDLGDLYIRNRGQEAMRDMFRHRSYIDRGIKAPGHSDDPVCTPNPFRAMWSMMTRTTQTGERAGPEEVVTAPEAVHAYTTLGAWVGRDEHAKGRLAPGMLADAAVLDRDIFTIDPDAVAETEVTMTLLDGAVVHRTQ